MAKKNYRCNRLRATLALLTMIAFTNCSNLDQKELLGFYHESYLGDKYTLLIDSNYVVQTIVTKVYFTDTLNNKYMKDTIIVNKCGFFIDGDKMVFDGWFLQDISGPPTLCVGCPLIYKNGKLRMDYYSLDGKKYTFYKVR